MASRPLPACVDFTFRSEPRDVITMCLIVGESSTTKILLVLLSSGMTEFRPAGSAPRLNKGEEVIKRGAYSTGKYRIFKICGRRVVGN
ncbi:MAG: hypothetical protein V7638_2649 [Acidobacteriota bacterium]|jgi:hypothetical protein